MQNSSEKLFVVLAGTETKKYTFDIATEEEIFGSKMLIKIVQVDNSCIGNELIEMCYGMKHNSLSRNIGNIPSFFMPLQETNEPDLYIDNMNSVLGHIKFCLMRGLNILQHTEFKEKSMKLRNEAITNFRVQRPISLYCPPSQQRL